MHNDEIHNLNSLPNIIKFIKPRRVKTGHAARMRAKRCRYRFKWERQKERNH
jgi:hypothetical protein